MFYSVRFHVRTKLIVALVLLAQLLLYSAAQAQQSQVQLDYFEVTPADVVIAGEPITVRWGLSGVTAADEPTLFVKEEAGYPGYNPLSVSATGVHQLNTRENDGGWAVRGSTYAYSIYLATDATFLDASQSIIASQTVDVQCRYLWFMVSPDDTSNVPLRACPERPFISNASQQSFENGFMLWIEELDEIWVVTSTQFWEFDDWYQEGIDMVSNPAIIPPNGLLQPEYGFGKIWRDNPHIRSALGWAIAQPVNFETVGQSDILNYSTMPRLWRLADGSVLQNGDVVDNPNYDGWANPHDGFRPELGDTPDSSRTPNTRPTPPPQPPTGRTPCPEVGAWPPGCDPSLPPTIVEPPTTGRIPCPKSGAWPAGCDPSLPPTTVEPPTTGRIPCPKSGTWPAGCDPSLPPTTVEPPNREGCVIPPSGKWPACATGG